MRTVILGAGGQLASDLEKAMGDWELFPLAHADLDICDHEQVEARLSEIEPAAVINTAAFHQVDDCEVEVEKAFRVNAIAVHNLARICADLDCRLMLISTDYVFGGEKRSPYSEDDLPSPLNVYGVSKLAGEHFVRSLCPKHFVVRTSGLYGLAGSSGKGGNFVETMIRLAHEGRSIEVVDDQVLSPTFTGHLSDPIGALLTGETFGTFHLSNEGGCSWFEFASEIFDKLGMEPDLAPTTTQEYGAVAARPGHSVLANERARNLGLAPLPTWRQALDEYLTDKGHRRIRAAEEDSGASARR